MARTDERKDGDARGWRQRAVSKSLSAAGRELFAVSRARKANPNDADRLRKYLARFGLRWQELPR